MPITLLFSRYTKQPYTVFAYAERSLFVIRALRLLYPKVTNVLSDIKKAPKRCINKLLFLPINKKRYGTVNALLRPLSTVQVPNYGCYPFLSILVSKSSRFLLKSSVFAFPFPLIVQNIFMAFGQGLQMKLSICYHCIFNSDLPFKNNIR